MEFCPRCKKMTGQKDIYTGEIACYNGECYEAGFVFSPSTANDEFEENSDFSSPSDEALLQYG